jgi:predicted alpha-1,2-mannosidase
MKTTTLCIVGMILLANATAQAQDNTRKDALLWQIGTRDKIAAEFAGGTKGSAASYKEGDLYIVTVSDPAKDWPFALPGPVDSWAGSTCHANTILFQLARVGDGNATLILNFTDTHDVTPPLLRIRVNGYLTEQRMPHGGGGGIDGKTAQSKPYEVAVPIAAGQLLPGINRIEISNEDGSWIIWDALRLFASKGTSLEKHFGGPVEIRAAAIRGRGLIERNGRSLQPIEIVIRHVGSDQDATVRCGDAVTSLRLRQGMNTASLLVPEIKRVEESEAIVETGGQIFHVPFRREPVFQDYVDRVRPWIGSNTGRWFQTVVACQPLGMIGITPDTEIESRFGGSGYVYRKTTLYGFSHLHGWALGALLVMPTTGGISPAQGPGGWMSGFQHEKEVLTAGYCREVLDRYGITAEITATARSAYHRWTFSKDATADIFFDLHSMLSEAEQDHAEVTKVGDAEIEGWVHLVSGYGGDNDDAGRVYFVAKFSKPFASLNAWKNGEQGSISSISGHPLVVYPRFSVKRGEQLTMRIGLSFCDIAGARKNLGSEIGDKNFDTVRAESRAEWNAWLGRVQVAGGTDQQQIKFYTDVWHTLFGRLTLNDVDGRYNDRMSHRIRQLPMLDGKPAFRVFSTDSFWWSMWNLNPWLGMAYPSVLEEWVHDSLLWYDNDPQHRIPWGVCNGAHSWIMMGCQRTPLICRAIQMNMKGIDAEKAYRAMKQMHSSPRIGGTGWMDGLSDYLSLGYIPYDSQFPDGCRAASLTVDDAFTDWCLAQAAKKLGHAEDCEMFLQRSKNWANLWDGQYIRPRYRNGKWADFDPLVGRNRGYCEANAEQYSFFSVQDVPGVARLMGGFDKYAERLDADFRRAEPRRFAFAEGQFGTEGPVNFANEANLQAAHLFNYAGKPWLSQYWARKVQNLSFSQVDASGGYAFGDEDQGLLGSFSALLAIGLFSTRGGCENPPIYEITPPIFDTVTVQLDPRYYPAGKFVIKTYNNSPGNCYIQSAKLDGKPLVNCWICQSDFAAGKTLELWLGPKPNNAWGVAVPPYEAAATADSAK